MPVNFRFSPFREGISYLEITRIVQSHDIARIGEIDDGFLFGHESIGRREFHLLAAAYMEVIPVALERPGTYLQESDTVAVVRVHIGVYLEHETGHLGLGRLHRSRLGRRRTRRRSYLDEGFEQLLHPEVVDGTPEKDRCEFAGQIEFPFERFIHPSTSDRSSRSFRYRAGYTRRVADCRAKRQPQTQSAGHWR